MTSFAHQHHTGELVRKGVNRKRRFVTSMDWNGGSDNTRVSAHFYNTREEIDLFLEALDTVEG